MGTPSSNSCPAGPPPLNRLDVLFKDYADSQRKKRDEEAARRAAAQKDLFIKGAKDGTAVHPSDVVQGGHKNCFLVAAMAAVAQSHPDPDAWMKNAITINADGTYNVTFYDKQADGSFKPRVVENVDGRLVNPASSDEKGEKWPAILEKAYAEAYGTAPAPVLYGFGDGGGHATQAMERLTGKPSEYKPMTSMTLNQLAAAHFSGQAIAAQTHNTATGPQAPAGPGPFTPDPPPVLPGYSGNDYSGPGAPRPNDLSPWHVYYVTGVDPGTGMVQINNVWDGPEHGGRQDINMPFEDFQRAFMGVHMNPVK
jgi:hypothetical protein